LILGKKKGLLQRLFTRKISSTQGFTNSVSTLLEQRRENNLRSMVQILQYLFAKKEDPSLVTVSIVEGMRLRM
jgi:F0F1-type ATP synthase delta subunit